MITRFLSTLILSIFFCGSAFGQAAASTKPDGEAAAKKAREAKAVSLLEQAIEDSALLKSLENRIRIQAIGADLLWSRNEKRARSLLSEAMSNFTSLAGSTDTRCQQCYNGIQTAVQLRGELIQVAAQHDPALALKFMRSSRLSVPERSSTQQYLSEMERQQEQGVAASAAARDPRLAEEMAEDSIKTGLSYNVINVLSELRSKDQEAATKLAAVLLDRLRSERFAENTIAFSVAAGLINLALPASQQDGQQDNDGDTRSSANSQESAASAGAQDTAAAPMLKPSELQDLARQLIALALNPPAGDNPAEASDRYNTIIRNLEPLAPQLVKLVPEQASALNEKISAFNESVDPSAGAWNQLQPLLQSGNVGMIIDAADKAPEGMRFQIYQQAAMKAQNDGDPARARQIINDKISDLNERELLLSQLQRISIDNASASGKLEEARAAASQVRSPEERAGILLHLAGRYLGKGDKKPAMELTDEAAALIPGRARGYHQLGIQLQIAQGYLQLEPSRSAAILGRLADHFNSLISAAAVLDGFDIQNTFREDELKMQGAGSAITPTFIQYASVLSQLAEFDFDSAASIASLLERPEARTFARLTIARGILAGQQALTNQLNFGGGFGSGYVRSGGLVFID